MRGRELLGMMNVISAQEWGWVDRARLQMALHWRRRLSMATWLAWPGRCHAMLALSVEHPDASPLEARDRLLLLAEEELPKPPKIELAASRLSSSPPLLDMIGRGPGLGPPIEWGRFQDTSGALEPWMASWESPSTTLIDDDRKEPQAVQARRSRPGGQVAAQHRRPVWTDTSGSQRPPLNKDL